MAQKIMTLDDKLKSGQMTRRDFLRLGGKALTVGAAGAAGLNILSTLGCKSPNGPDIPEEVDIQLDIYKHMQGLARTIVKRGYTNSVLQVGFNELGVDGVSAMYLVGRKPNMGERVGHTNSGVLAIQTDSSTRYEVHCFSLDGGVTDSDLEEIYQNGRDLVVGRDQSWFRQNANGRTPNNEYQGIFDFVFSELNSALIGPFKVGSCYANGGNLWNYGCAQLGAPGDKSVTEHWVRVDDVRLGGDTSAIQKIATSELLETMARTNNIRNTPSWEVICPGGTLNTLGINLLRGSYIMAK